MTGRVGTPTTNATEGSGEVGDLSREWRQRVDRRLDSAAQALENAAIIIERINGKLDAHEIRISKLESSPAGLRSDITGYGGCLAMAAGMLVSSAIGAIGLVVSIIALVTRH